MIARRLSWRAAASHSAVPEVNPVDEYGNGRSAEQGIGVGLIGHFALGGLHAADHSAGEQAIGQQDGFMERGSSQTAEIENQTPIALTFELLRQLA